MSETVVRGDIAPAELATLIQGRGFRAELATGPVLLSATGGLGFRVEFGNRAAGEGERFLDFTLVCAVELEGADAAAAAARWNGARRFARAQARERLVLLDMDVLVVGVTDAHLLARLEIWDHLVQLLITDLRAAI